MFGVELVSDTINSYHGYFSIANILLFVIRIVIFENQIYYCATTAAHFALPIKTITGMLCGGVIQ